MLIMIPNMKGYIRLYKYFVDYKNMKIHNLECMSLKVFKTFSDRNNLKTLKLNYFGGFPFNVHQKLNVFQKIIFQVHRFVFKRMLNKLIIKKPSKILSSTIIGIFEKK